MVQQLGFKPMPFGFRFQNTNVALIGTHPRELYALQGSKNMAYDGDSLQRSISVCDFIPAGP